MFSGTFIFFVAIAVLLASIFILLEVLSLTSRKKVSKIFCDEDGNIKWLLVISAISSLIGCIILFLFIIIVYKQKILNLTPVKEDLAHYGQYGDFIGGVVATLFSLTGVLLLYETLKTQRNQFAEQAKDTVVQRFENKYYEMIKLHRSNVEEMNIQGLILERKVFIPMFYEFRYILSSGRVLQAI